MAAGTGARQVKPTAAIVFHPSSSLNITPKKERPMPKDKEFPTGLFVSPPRPTAPDFVKGRISIKVEDFMEYLSEKDSEWLRIDLKQSKRLADDGGEVWYAQVDSWVQPSERVQEGGHDAKLPF